MVSLKKATVSTPALENLERVLATLTSLPLKIVIIIMMKTWMNPQTPTKPTMTQLTPEVMTEKKLWTMMTRKTNTFSSYVTLDDVTVFEAAELDANALLADTWDSHLDPEVSAQLVQASAQAYLSFGKHKGNGKGKAKGKGKGRYLLEPSHLSLENLRRRLKELKAKTECRACGRKGHWANDRECAMSLSSSTQNQTRTARMATRQQLTNQPSESCWSVFRSQRKQ